MSVGWLSVCLLWQNVYSDPQPIFNQIAWFFAFVLYEFFVYFGYLPLIRYMICKYFLPFSRVPFCFVDGLLCYAG